MLAVVGAGYLTEDTWLVRDLSLQLHPGRVTAVVGPNGAGKSTALRLASGLLPATEGKVIVDGRPIDSISRRDLARIVTFVPQNPPTEASFTVRECAAMGRYCHRGRFQSETDEDRRAIRRALLSVDCSHLVDRLLREVSWGELQRVVLARSLATEAHYLLLDEPTANLDIEHSLAILDVLRRMAAQGRSVLLALHDLNSVLRSTDYVYVLHRGRLRAAGPPKEVLSVEIIREVFSVEARMLVGSEGASFRFERLPGAV